MSSVGATSYTHIAEALLIFKELQSITVRQCDSGFICPISFFNHYFQAGVVLANSL